MAATKSYQPQLKTAYCEQIRPKLLEEFKLRNLHQVAKLEKIVLNVGLGRFKDDKQMLATAANTLAKITGQKAQPTKARLSIANFKLRTGQQVGYKVTLRDQRMYEFLERLINLVIPRFRDFHGISLKSFDAGGNYTLGFPNQALFPELSFEETNPSHGLEAVFVFENRTAREMNYRLLQEFGLKFEKKKEDNG